MEHTRTIDDDLWGKRRKIFNEAQMRDRKNAAHFGKIVRFAVCSIFFFVSLSTSFIFFFLLVPSLLCIIFALRFVSLNAGSVYV